MIIQEGEKLLFSQDQEGKTEIKGEVLDQISCEVKESLTSIIGFSNIIKSSCLDPKQIEQINNVLISSEKLLEFANNISDFSKLMSGKYEANNYTFSTKKLLNEILLCFESAIKKKAIYFEIDISEVKIKNDYQLTSQIIHSIFNHLIKMSPEDSVIFIKNKAFKNGIVIEINAEAVKSFNNDKIQDINDIANSKDNYNNDLSFCLTNHLINLIDGEITFSNLENNFSKIIIYIPNKPE